MYNHVLTEEQKQRKIKCVTWDDKVVEVKLKEKFFVWKIDLSKLEKNFLIKKNFFAGPWSQWKNSNIRNFLVSKIFFFKFNFFN